LGVDAVSLAMSLRARGVRGKDGRAEFAFSPTSWKDNRLRNSTTKILLVTSHWAGGAGFLIPFSLPYAKGAAPHWSTEGACWNAGPRDYGACSAFVCVDSSIPHLLLLRPARQQQLVQVLYNVRLSGRVLCPAAPRLWGCFVFGDTDSGPSFLIDRMKRVARGKVCVVATRKKKRKSNDGTPAVSAAAIKNAKVTTESAEAAAVMKGDEPALASKSVVVSAALKRQATSRVNHGGSATALSSEEAAIVVANCAMLTDGVAPATVFRPIRHAESFKPSGFSLQMEPTWAELRDGLVRGLPLTLASVGDLVNLITEYADGGAGLLGIVPQDHDFALIRINVNFRTNVASYSQLCTLLRVWNFPRKVVGSTLMESNIVGFQVLDVTCPDLVATPMDHLHWSRPEERSHSVVCIISVRDNPFQVIIGLRHSLDEFNFNTSQCLVVIDLTTLRVTHRSRYGIRFYHDCCSRAATFDRQSGVTTIAIGHSPHQTERGRNLRITIWQFDAAEKLQSGGHVGPSQGAGGPLIGSIRLCGCVHMFNTALLIPQVLVTRGRDPFIVARLSMSNSTSAVHAWRVSEVMLTIPSPSTVAKRLSVTAVAQIRQAIRPRTIEFQHPRSLPINDPTLSTRHLMIDLGTLTPHCNTDIHLSTSDEVLILLEVPQEHKSRIKNLSANMDGRIWCSWNLATNQTCFKQSSLHITESSVHTHQIECMGETLLVENRRQRGVHDPPGELVFTRATNLLTFSSITFPFPIYNFSR
jgi:hypothetical protein